MLPLEDPCEGCLINVMCEQMCPKAIEYYKQRVRIRPKHEVEVVTGYYWNDDYIDDKGVIHPGQAKWKKEKEESTFIPTKTKPGIIEKFINFIKKGKMLWATQLNKSILKD